MFRFSTIRCLSNGTFISPHIRARFSSKSAPLLGVKILAMHDSAIAHLVLKTLKDFGAEIIDASPAVCGKIIDDESQIQRNILVNMCRKTDLLIEGFPAGTLQRNELQLDHFIQNNSTMVTARFTDNLYSSVQGKLYSYRSALELTGEVFLVFPLSRNGCFSLIVLCADALKRIRRLICETGEAEHRENLYSCRFLCSNRKSAAIEEKNAAILSKRYYYWGTKDSTKRAMGNGSSLVQTTKILSHCFSKSTDTSSKHLGYAVYHNKELERVHVPEYLSDHHKMQERIAASGRNMRSLFEHKCVSAPRSSITGFGAFSCLFMYVAVVSAIQELHPAPPTYYLAAS
ncbi:unnamed protein product [Toxocara canis]|uniref:Iso_dh domain-containing protein n=1 Tax=Toxocara canis TaxID=6265 RepID=A0A183TVF1_TOXCA|nr:unnamed protein product [Toxocara canis]